MAARKSSGHDNPESTGGNRDKVGPGNPPKEHQFKPGNPGRPKGSRNKLGEAFIADLYADWQDNGSETIQKVRETRPQDYLKVVASILPKELNISVEDELSDAELDERIRQLAAALSLEIGTGEPAGREGQAEAAEPAGDIRPIH